MFLVISSFQLFHEVPHCWRTPRQEQTTHHVYVWFTAEPTLWSDPLTMSNKQCLTVTSESGSYILVWPSGQEGQQHDPRGKHWAPGPAPTIILTTARECSEREVCAVAHANHSQTERYTAYVFYTTALAAFVINKKCVIKSYGKLIIINIKLHVGPLDLCTT